MAARRRRAAAFAEYLGELATARAARDGTEETADHQRPPGASGTANEVRITDELEKQIQC